MSELMGLLMSDTVNILGNMHAMVLLTPDNMCCGYEKRSAKNGRMEIFLFRKVSLNHYYCYCLFVVCVEGLEVKSDFTLAS